MLRHPDDPFETGAVVPTRCRAASNGRLVRLRRTVPSLSCGQRVRVCRTEWVSGSRMKQREDARPRCWHVQRAISRRPGDDASSGQRAERARTSAGRRRHRGARPIFHLSIAGSGLARCRGADRWLARGSGADRPCAAANCRAVASSRRSVATRFGRTQDPPLDRDYRAAAEVTTRRRALRYELWRESVSVAGPIMGAPARGRTMGESRRPAIWSAWLSTGSFARSHLKHPSDVAGQFSRWPRSGH